MLNKLFFSTKAHRIFTALFMLSFFAYVNVVNISISETSINNNIIGAGIAVLVAYYYEVFYGIYFIIRFIWRIFNKPDINQYEIDKRNMSREQLMNKYGIYRC